MPTLKRLQFTESAPTKAVDDGSYAVPQQTWSKAAASWALQIRKVVPK